MWFVPSSDPKQAIRALWLLLKWLILGPAVGAVVVGIFAFLLGMRGEGIPNAMVWGAIFGAMAGIMATMARVLAYWRVD